MYSNSKSCYYWLNKSAILSQVKPLSFIEARRIKMPLHKALITELYETGCTKAAKCFENFIKKEDFLLKKKNIHSRLSSKSELFTELFENIKEAEELSVKSECGSMFQCFQRLYRAMKILEPYTHSFKILLCDLFYFIIEICDKYVNNLKFNKNELCVPSERINIIFEGSEYIARVYFKYAKFLQDTGGDELTAIKYFEQAQEFTRSESWTTKMPTEWGILDTLHQEIGEHLTTMLINYSKQLIITDSEKAVAIGNTAILTIAERGIHKNLLLFLDARLSLVEILLSNKDFVTASSHLTYMKAYMPYSITGRSDGHFKILYCKMTLCEGVCEGGLNNLESSEQKFEECLQLTKKFNYLHLHGQVLLDFGKILWQHKQFERAEMKFKASKALFLELGDIEMHKMTIYVFAKLKSEEILKPFISLLQVKGNSVMPAIRKWKYTKTAFWNMEIDENVILHSLFDTMYVD